MLKFKTLINGGYNEKLMDFYNIPKTEENLGKAKKHWNRKHNSLGEYDVQEIREDILIRAVKTNKRLESICQPL